MPTTGRSIGGEIAAALPKKRASPNVKIPPSPATS
jgi:hypothetical protein